jgi:hypothetical protein
LNLVLSPEAAASASCWHSLDSSLRLLASIAALLLIADSHPCFAAAAAAEFVLPPPELELDVEVVPAPPELELGVDVLPAPPELELGADVLCELLLPQPVSTALPATTNTTKTTTLALMTGPFVEKLAAVPYLLARREGKVTLKGSVGRANSLGGPNPTVTRRRSPPAPQSRSSPNTSTASPGSTRPPPSHRPDPIGVVFGRRESSQK